MKNKINLCFFKQGPSNIGYGKEWIYMESIFSLRKNIDNTITFRELCEGSYLRELSKNDAIAALQEAISWMNEKHNYNLPPFSDGNP